MNSAGTHTVLRLTDRNSWNSLTEFRERRPCAGKGEVLIKVRSVALNHRDLAIATGTYAHRVRDRVIPGSDAAGDIVMVGKDVRGFAISDKVVIAYDQKTRTGPIKSWNWGLGGPIDGVMREYISVSEHAVAKIPKDSPLSYARWAGTASFGVIAWNALYGDVPIKSGQTVLFLGTGGLCLWGLMLAKAAGAITIITSFDPDQLRYVKNEFGPTHAIFCNEKRDWAVQAQRLTSGRGVDHVFDIGGAVTIEKSIEAVAFGGTISLFDCVGPKLEGNMPDVVQLALRKGVKMRAVLHGSKQHLDEVIAFIAAHELRMPIEKIFHFDRDQVVAAYKYLAGGQPIGKVCVVFGWSGSVSC